MNKKAFTLLHILIFYLSFFMLACSFDWQDKNNTATKEIEDIGKLQKAYAPLEGFYSGTVTTQDGTQSFPAELLITVQNVSNGTNRDGRSVIRPVLKAKFRRTDTVDATGDVFMEASYYEETGDLSLSNASSANGSLNLISIKGRFVSGNIVGEFFRDGGLVGNVNLKWVSQSPNAPFNGTELEDRQRVLQILGPIVGTYSGKVISASDNSKTFDVLISLYIAEIPTGLNRNGQPTFMPTLKGFYRKIDPTQSKADLPLTVRYFDTDQVIVLNYSGANASGDYVSIRGKISSKGAISSAEVVDNKGKVGNLVADKISNEPSVSTTQIEQDEQEERVRLRELYQPLVGTYEGFMRATDATTDATTTDAKEKKYPVELSLYLTEAPKGTNKNGETIYVPILRGKYRRLDIVENRGDVLLNVRYFSMDKSLVLNDAALDSKDSLALNLTFLPETASIQGQVTHSLGLLGQISLHRSSLLPKSPFEGSEIEERERVLNVLKPLVGTYAGKVTSAEKASNEKSFDSLISIYISEIPTGLNRNGQPTFMPTLRGFYRKIDPTQTKADIPLTVRYFNSDQMIVLNSSGQGGEFISIRGKIGDKGGITLAEVIDNRGKVGDLQAEKISNEPSVSVTQIEQDEQEERARLRTLYLPLVGTYEGLLQSGGSSDKKYPVELSLYLVEAPKGTNKNGETIYVPILRGKYRRSDIVESRGDVLLNVRYFSNDKSLIMNSAVADSKDALAFNLIFTEAKGNEAKIVGQVTHSLGVLGQVSLQRTSLVPKSPIDGVEVESRNRLLAMYKAIAGVYKGPVTPPDGAKGWTATLTVFVVEKLDPQGNMRPALRANYQRDDFDPGLASRQLTIEYFPENNSIAMVTTTEERAGTVPGAGFFSMTGTLVGNQFILEVKDHRGIVGSFKGTRFLLASRCCENGAEGSHFHTDL